MSKRLLILIGVVAVIVLGLAGVGLAFAFGQHSGQTSATSGTPTTTSTTASSKIRSVKGVILSLGSSTFKMTMGKGKKTVTVNVSDQTKITTVQGAGTFSDLKVGQTVQVKGHVNPVDKSIDASSVLALPPSGIVSTIQGQTLTLTASDGKTIMVNTGNSTVVYVGAVPVSAKSIEIGQTVGYEGTTAGNGSVNADKLWLLFLPSVRGTVAAISGNMLTLQAAKSTVDITLSPNTTYVQGGKTHANSTPIPSSVQLIQVGSQLVITEDAKSTSGTPTAVLVLIA